MLHTALRSIKWWFMFQNAGESTIVPRVHWRSSESPALVGPLADLLLCRWGLSGNKEYLLVIIIPLRVLMAAIIVNGMSPLDFYQQRSFSLESIFIEPSYYNHLCSVPGCRPCASGGPRARCASRSRSCSCWRLRRRWWARPRRCTRSAAVCRSPPGPPCPWSWPLQLLHFDIGIL